MTQEDIELLLTDLCARLRYGVKVQYWHRTSTGAERKIGELVNIDLRINCSQLLFRINNYYFESDSIETSKPYLRPMSSMTEEENKELSKLLNYEFYIDQDFALCAEDDRHRIRLDLIKVYIDFLNSHHFDYRGLIEKGLALEAPEGMYKN